MKKGLSIFFLIYYLIFSFGFIVNKHFCQGELVSLEIMLPADGCCEDEENSCCSNDQDIIFLHDHQQNMQSVTMVQTIVTVTPTLPKTDSESVVLFEKKNWLSTDDPPPIKKISSYILNCSLTVYG